MPLQFGGGMGGPPKQAIVAVALLSCILSLVATPAAAGGPKTRLVSVTSAGDPVAGTDQTVISGNGLFVAFQANANQLPGMDGIPDVYVHDVAAGKTRLASRTSSGAPADGPSQQPSLSGDGNLVAFQSTADNLPGGDGSTLRVYVHNRETGKTTLASKTSGGTPVEARDPFISRNGRLAAFRSDDPALPGEDGIPQAYVRDLDTGKTKLVSKTTAGMPAEGFDPSLSADGRFVVFLSQDSDLPGGDGSTSQIYVHDRQAGTTELVSRTDAGVGAYGGGCWWPAISGNGRFAAFYCYSPNLPGGSLNTSQVYVHDRELDDTEIVSVNSSGDPAGDDSYDPSLSNSGRYVTFYSLANNLPGNADASDAFRHDRQSNKTAVVSKNSAGAVANEFGDTFDPSMSADGRWVAFRASGTNMPGGTVSHSYIRGPLG
jgi:Tol biopolymer transport system component